MNAERFVTVGEVARLYGVDQWRVRRIVDELDGSIPRAGQYRLIPHKLLGDIEQRLQELGCSINTGRADTEKGVSRA